MSFLSWSFLSFLSFASFSDLCVTFLSAFLEISALQGRSSEYIKPFGKTNGLGGADDLPGSVLDDDGAGAAGAFNGADALAGGVLDDAGAFVGAAGAFSGADALAGGVFDDDGACAGAVGLVAIAFPADVATFAFDNTCGLAGTTCGCVTICATGADANVGGSGDGGLGSAANVGGSADGGWGSAALAKAGSSAITAVAAASTSAASATESCGVCWGRLHPLWRRGGVNFPRREDLLGGVGNGCTFSGGEKSIASPTPAENI